MSSSHLSPALKLNPGPLATAFPRGNSSSVQKSSPSLGTEALPPSNGKGNPPRPGSPRAPASRAVLHGQGLLSRGSRNSLRRDKLGKVGKASSSTSQLLQVLLTLLAECLARFGYPTCAPSVLCGVEVFSQRYTREIRLHSQVALHRRMQQRTDSRREPFPGRGEFPDGIFTLPFRLR